MPYYVPRPEFLPGTRAQFNSYELDGVNAAITAFQTILIILAVVVAIRSFSKWSKRAASPTQRIGLLFMVCSLVIASGFLLYNSFSYPNQRITTHPLIYAEKVAVSRYDPEIKKPSPPTGINVVETPSGWGLYDENCLIEKDWTPDNKVYPAPPVCLKDFVSNRTMVWETKWRSSIGEYKYKGLFILLLVSGLFTAGIAMYGGFVDRFLKWIKQGNC